MPGFGATGLMVASRTNIQGKPCQKFRDRPRLYIICGRIPTTPRQRAVKSMSTSPIHWELHQGQLWLQLPHSKSDFPVSEPDSPWLQAIAPALEAAQNQAETPPETPLLAHISSQDQLLDVRQLQALEELCGRHHITLKSIHTGRRKTAIAAVTLGLSVWQLAQEETFGELPPEPAIFPLAAPEPKAEPSNQTPDPPQPNPFAQEGGLPFPQAPKFSLPQAQITVRKTSSQEDVLYLKNSLRSGMDIQHQGSVVVYGDVNPGGAIQATGDILIWGRLRGVAHAGTEGDRQAKIMALKMEPTQLRIADLVARLTPLHPDEIEPEIAYLAPDGIRLIAAHQFGKSYEFSATAQGWIKNSAISLEPPVS